MGGRAAAGFLLSLAACSGSGEPIVLLLPPVADASSAIIFIDDGSTLELQAFELDEPPVLNRELQPGARRLISLVMFTAHLDELGLEPGPVAAPTTTRPMPLFADAFETLFQDGELGEWTRIRELRENISKWIYTEGCQFTETGTGQLCLPNVCPGDCKRDFCWSPPVPWTALNSGTGEDGVTAVVERGELWFYFVTHRWTSTSTSDRGRGDHARVRLLDATTPDMSTLAKAPSTERTDLETIGRPTISSDGRELWFHADILGGRRESLRSHKPSPDSDWWPSEVGLPGLDTKRIDDPVLLADRRTLLVFLGASLGNALTVMTRPTATPGDLGFDLVAATPQLFGQASDATVSCDGFHLLFVFDQEDEVIPSAIPILLMSSLEFGQRVPLIDLPSRLDGLPVVAIGESPDCSAVYLSNGERIYYATPRPCD